MSLATVLGIVSVCVLVLGVILIVVGTLVSLADWRRSHQQPPMTDKVLTERHGLPETLEGLAKLADALKAHPLGMQLVFVGVLLLVIGGALGASGALTA